MLPRWYNPLTLLGPRGAIPKLAVEAAPVTSAINPVTVGATAAAAAAMRGDPEEAHVPAKRGVYTQDLEERLGYGKADALRWHRETVDDPRSSPFERSQSAKTLIEGVLNDPTAAPIISGGTEAKSATERTLETFLPSMFEGDVSEEFLTSTQADLMGDIDWDRVEADEVVGGDPPSIDTLPPVAQTPWETLSEKWTDRRKALYEPSTESGMGGILTSDQTAWDNAVAEGNESQIDNLGDKHDTRRHLDAVFGTDTAGATDPRLDRFWGARQTAADAIVPSIPSDTIRDVLLKSMDNKLRIKGTIATGNTKAVSETLKDLVNNNLFIGARDAGHSAEDAYNNPNTVISSDNFDVLSEALVDGKAHIDQLDAALELVGDAAEDNRVVESFTEQGLIDIASQVESFSDMPVVPQPEPVSSDSRKEQRKEAAKQKERDKKAAAKREAADKRAADKAAAKSARISAAQKRNIAKVAKASRKAEAKREADTKKRAQEQRDKLDSASKKALQDHMAWMATQTERLAKEERERAKRYAGGTGGALMWT